MALVLAFLEKQTGGQCFPGHYCPEGNSNPIPCGNGTFRIDTHGSAASDCGPCAAGMQCYSGNPIPTYCPRGNYYHYYIEQY